LGKTLPLVFAYNHAIGLDRDLIQEGVAELKRPLCPVYLLKLSKKECIDFHLTKCNVVCMVGIDSPLGLDPDRRAAS
jgi:hypothetical protein